MSENFEVRLADANNSNPRTGVFTMRNSSDYHVSRCPGYEFEDLIVNEFEPSAVFIEPAAYEEQIGLRAKRWLGRQRIPTSNFSFGAQTRSIGQDLDLFFAAPAVPNDLLTLPTLNDWRKRSRVAVCYLQELWISEMDAQLVGIADILRQFDHVYVGLYHTAEALSKRLGITVEYMPLGIDAEMWNPYRGTPKSRDIDVCSIGHMDSRTHDALWDWANETGRYYSFTTTSSATLSVSHKNHRQNLAQTLQRSKFFFTYLAKRTTTLQRGTQKEFGPRYFEGAGAGAIQIGDAVKSNPAFIENMSWDGSVIEMPYSSSDIPALLEDIEKEASWLEDVRRRNVSNCLLRHDHLNRWDIVMNVVGFEETPSAAARRARLAEQAAHFESKSVPFNLSQGQGR